MLDSYGESVSMAWENIVAHKFRSFLTVLGIIIGVLTVIVIASILTGLRRNVVTMVEEFGTNNIFAFHLATGPQLGRRPRAELLRKPLTVADAVAVRELCPSVADVAWEGFPRRTRTRIEYRKYVLRNFHFKGVPANWAAVTGARLAGGRFFSEFEDARRARVVVLGADPAEGLFPQTDALGKSILINGSPFTVVGVLAHSRGSFLGESETDNQIVVPYESWRKMMPWEETHFLLIQAKPDKLAQALDETESVLRRRRGVKPAEPRNFDLSTAERVIQQFDAITASIGLIAIAISSIGLVVGGIGVMNIMLVSVTERTQEIGIRKAVGATRRDIVRQFLCEAMTLTGAGGILGVALAIAVSTGIEALAPSIPASIPVWAVVTGFTVSIAVGLTFGVWPARKAARLDPIEALRYE